MAKTSAPPPAGLKRSGNALWGAVTTEYELEEHERGLLLQLARTADLLDDLAAVIGSEGVLDQASGRVHPAAVEHRQQAIAFARLAAALRLPAGEEDDDSVRRPQRRTGVRGVYLGNAS